MNSPAVRLQEIDKTHYLPNFTNEVACFAGYFEKGPIDKPIFITDINQFKFIFGRGIGLHHNDWYQVYNYLQYSTGIWVVRSVGNRFNNAVNTGDKTIAFDSKEDFDNNYAGVNVSKLEVIAQTPGTWGDLLTISVISYFEWVDNKEIYNGLMARNYFTYFEPGFVGICVLRNGKLVERFYKNEETLSEINSESAYVYIRYDGSDFISDYVPRYDANSENDFYDLNIHNSIPFYRDANESAYGRRYETAIGENSLELIEGWANFPTDIDIKNSYDIFLDKGLYDIDIVIGNDKHNLAAVELAEARRDCIAFIGTPTTFIEYLKLMMGNDPQLSAYTQSGLVIGTKETKIPYRVTDIHIQKLYEYMESIPKSQFVHFTMNVKEQLDGFTGKYKLVNIAGDTAGLKAKASLDSPWSVGAGLERGVIKNIETLYFKVKNPETFYKMGLNYIHNNTLMSQKTYTTKASSFGRINVRSLFNHIEKEVEKLLRYYVFEENTYRVRGIIASTIKKYLEDVKANNGIDAGRVEVRGQDKEIIVDVYIKPKYSIEYIQLRMKNAGSETISNILSNTLA